jgi:hypothetical protein
MSEASTSEYADTCSLPSVLRNRVLEADEIYR